MRILTFLLILTMPAMGAAHELVCKPDLKYECDRENCQRTTEGFQYAESFSFNEHSALLTACLWTNCYSAKAAVIRDPASGSTVAIARLLPTNTEPGYGPVIVSLAYDSKGNFNSTWGYATQALTFDFGQCTRSR